MNDDELQTMEEIPQSDPFPVSDPVSETQVPETPVLDDMPEQNEKEEKTTEEIPPQGDALSPETSSGADDQEQIGEDRTDGETDAVEDGEDSGDGGITNITIVRPPVQTFYNVQADTEATYHVMVENAESDPVPVVVTETLMEKEPGIMEKRLEDYTVTEGLLLCILIVLVLRMVFDYGRRLF